MKNPKIKDKISSKISKFLISFDNFGITYNFHFKSNYYYKSKTGGFGFLSLIIFYIIIIMANLFDLLERKNVSLIYSTKEISAFEKIIFSDFKYNFAFGLRCGENVNKEMLNNFYFMLDYVIRNKTDSNLNLSTININFHQCSLKDFGENYLAYFNSFELDKYYCPDYNNFSIQGIYTDAIFSFFRLSLYSKNLENEILNKIIHLLLNDECRFELYFIDSIIDVYDYKNPVKTYINSNFLVIKPSNIMKGNCYFKIYDLNDYDNLFIYKNKTIKILAHSGFESYDNEKDYFIQENQKNLFSRIYIRVAKESSFYERRYKTFYSFLSNISSYIYLSHFIFNFIFRYINYYFSLQNLIDNTFYFKIKNNKNFKIKLTKNFEENNKSNFNTIFKLNKFKSDFNLQNLINSKNILFNKSEEKLNNLNYTNIKKIQSSKSYFLNMNKKIKLNNKYVEMNLIELIFFKFFNCFLWKKLKIKIILFKKGLYHIFDILDIISYINFTRKIEILYYLMLKKNERKNIFYFSKPVLCLENNINLYSKINKYKEKSFFFNIVNNENKIEYEIKKKLNKIYKFQLNEYKNA